ncbi:hypothetical protein ACLX1H_009237 [Fusarium chlamydosporum]
MVNVKCLASDSMMTYHLQALQLYADTKTINAVAKAQTSSILTDREPAVRPRLQKLHNQLHLWKKSPESRRALLHALAVLLDCEAALESNSPQTQSIDPIAYLAISTSALVVWAWLLFGEPACSCVPSLNHINIGVDPPDLQNISIARLETWIQADGTAANGNSEYIVFKSKHHPESFALSGPTPAMANKIVRSKTCLKAGEKCHCGPPIGLVSRKASTTTMHGSES